MEAKPFSDLIAGCNESHLADYLQVIIKIFRCWKSSQAVPPHSAVIALQIYLAGEFGAVWPAWSGFRISQDDLITLGYFGRPIAPKQLLGMFFL